MINRMEVLAVLAIGPMAIGPLPTPGLTIYARLCNGGSISIPIKGEGDEDLPPEPCFKGCHAGTCRKRGLPSDIDADPDADAP